MDRCHRQKNGPGYEPDWQCDADHHPQETNEEVAVQPVDILDLDIVHVPDRNEPSQDAGRQWLLSLPNTNVSRKRSDEWICVRSEAPGFINERKIAPYEGKDDNLGSSDGPVQNQGRQESLGRRGVRFANTRLGPSNEMKGWN